MSAPERIVICPDDSEREWFQCDYQPHMGPWVGYLRADLHDATLTALRAQVETLREALADITDAAHGLSFGTDWNKGNHAILHGYRAKLLAAIAPARAALFAVSRDDTSEVSDG